MNANSLENLKKGKKFKKGYDERRNLKGAPTGKRMSTLLKKLIAKNAISESILQALILKAYEGDINALKLIFDRIDGKEKTIKEVVLKVDIEQFNASLLTVEQMKVFVRLLKIGMVQTINENEQQMTETTRNNSKKMVGNGRFKTTKMTSK